MSRQRNYAKETRWENRPEQVRNRVKRNQAARAMNCPKGHEVDHKKALSEGGTNARSNLRCVKRSVNRSGGAAIRERR